LIRHNARAGFARAMNKISFCHEPSGGLQRTNDRPPE
jgi:hypothetical protein